MRRGDRRPYDELARAIVRPGRPPTRMTGTTTAGGNDQETQADAWANPMTAVGDLIAGTEGGAAARLPIGAEGQILMVVGGVPTWVAQTVLTGNVIDSDGDLVVTSGGDFVVASGG